MNTEHIVIQKDLELTVKELSATYEELSLLYKLTEILLGMGADEIAEQVVEEAVNTLDVKTAALLFFDADEGKLYTKSFRGRWNRDTVISKGDDIIWNAITGRKPVAFCNLIEAGFRDYAHAEKSILVCPLIGKSRVIGAMVLADKEDQGEFYAHDIKLVMAIANHASLTIENAMLYKELEDFLVSAIKALVKALEASSRWTAGHTERVTEYAIGIGAMMGLSGKRLERLRVCSLLHDIGKIAVPREILDKGEMLTEEEERVMRRHPLIGAEILGGFTQLQDVISGIKYHHEWWDGNNSLMGLKGEDIPLTARILAVADTFDAMLSDRPYRRKKAEYETIEEIKKLSGKQFDPQVVDAFSEWISQQHSAFSL
ncbi:MAG TPA: HD domain-containing phosphohydrolase [Thermodesulfovibrionales bacterium]|nr:HD domain-containing phosphohydrolase [Thermodesulfovibrionales bacterium]